MIGDKAGRYEGRLKKGDIVLVETASGLRLSEIRDIFLIGDDGRRDYSVGDLTAITVHIFQSKSDLTTLLRHITEISDGEIAIRVLGEEDD